MQVANVLEIGVLGQGLMKRHLGSKVAAVVLGSEMDSVNLRIEVDCLGGSMDLEHRLVTHRSSKLLHFLGDLEDDREASASNRESVVDINLLLLILIIRVVVELSTVQSL